MKDAMSFKVGDYVWAKMKGYQAWPAKIVKPVKDVKQPNLKKPMQYVFFFGTQNHAWILEENIFPYKENENKFIKNKDKLSEAKRRSSFWLAVDAIEEEINPSVKTPKKSKIDDAETNGEVPKSKSSSSPSKSPEDKVKSISKSKKSVESMDYQTPKKPSMKRRVPDSGSSKSEMLPHKVRRASPDPFSPLLSDTPISVCTTPSQPPLQSYVPRYLPSKQSTLLRRRVADIDSLEPPPLDITTVTKTLEDKKVTPCKLKLGFLGLGIMGRGIVKNLVNSGHDVTVWNRTPHKCQDFIKAGACKGQTPADVVAASDITFSCVTDSSAAKELVFGNCGVLQEMTSKKGYVEITSIDPETSHDISEAVISRGGRYLEAPVIGSRELAEEGQLIVLSAGDRSLFTDCTSCFQAIGKHAFYLGSEVGNAARMNLMYHTVLGVVVASLAEALSFAEVVGVGQKDFMEIMELGSFRSPIILEKGPAMMNKKYIPPSMPLQHMQKNLQIALSIGDKHNHPMPVTAVANEVYKRSKHFGYSGHDIAAVYQKSPESELE